MIQFAILDETLFCSLHSLGMMYTKWTFNEALNLDKIDHNIANI